MGCSYQQTIFKVRKSQIRKFLRLIPKSQNRKYLQNTAQLCLAAALKVVFLHDFYCVQILIRALYDKFVRRKMMYLWTCGSFKSANHKKDWLAANRKSVKWHICGRSANITIYLCPQICGFGFAGLLCGPSTFGSYPGALEHWSSKSKWRV